MAKIRIIERPWIPEACRFAVETPNNTIAQVSTEEEAKEILAAYLKGPRVVAEAEEPVVA